MLAAGTMFWGDTFLDSVLANGVPSDEELRSISSFLCAHDCLQFDTAEGYGFGSSESRLSKAVRNNNDNSKEVRIWTKFMPTVWRWTRESFFSSLHNSLDRLNQIKPAIYFIHTPVHPMFLSWVQWAFEAKREGLIKGVGLSNCGVVEVEAALEIAKGFGDKIEANQIMFRFDEYLFPLCLFSYIIFRSLLDFACPSVKKVVHLCQKNDIKIIAYNILGQGLLTDRLNRENYGTFRGNLSLKCKKWNFFDGDESKLQKCFVACLLTDCPLCEKSFRTLLENTPPPWLLFVSIGQSDMDASLLLE